jgi:hypothetical protein
LLGGLALIGPTTILTTAAGLVLGMLGTMGQVWIRRFRLAR